MNMGGNFQSCLRKSSPGNAAQRRDAPAANNSTGPTGHRRPAGLCNVEDDMRGVQVSIDEEGALKVARRYDIRLPLESLRPQGFVRHRVAAGPDCSPLRTVPDRAFNRVLTVLFLCTVLLALISLIIFDQILTHGRHPGDPATWDYIFHQTWLFGYFPIERKGVAALAVFAALLAVGVLAKKTATRSAARRRAVPTISGRVQQL